MGTLTECLKGSCVRKNTYKILVEPTSDRLAENEVMSNNESQIVDEKKPHDISMHGVTVSEKGKFAFIAGLRGVIRIWLNIYGEALLRNFFIFVKVFNTPWDHLCSTYAKFSDKLTFLTP